MANTEVLKDGKNEQGEGTNPIEAPLFDHTDKVEKSALDSINIDFQQRKEAWDTLKMDREQIDLDPALIAELGATPIAELGVEGVKEALTYITDKKANLAETGRAQNHQEAEQTVTVAALSQEVSHIAQDYLRQNNQEKEIDPQKSLVSNIKEVIDRIPNKFFSGSRLKTATILSTVFFVVHGITDSAPAKHNNEHNRSIRPVAAEALTSENPSKQTEGPVTTEPGQPVVEATSGFLRVPEPETTSEAAEATEVFDLSTTVKDYLANKIEFPSNLSEEQKVAFVQEMENQRGAQPIYFEDDRDPGAIWINAGAGFAARYPEIAGEILGQKEGTYRVAKDFFDKHPEIAKELTPIKYQTARIDKETGNIQYLDDKTNQWVTIPNSASDIRQTISQTTPEADINKWLEYPTTKSIAEIHSKKFLNLLGDKYEQYANLPEVQARIKGAWGEGIFVPVILKANEFVGLPVYYEYGRYWTTQNFVQLLKVVKDRDGQAVYAIQFFAAAPSLSFYKEGSSFTDIANFRESSFNGPGIREKYGFYANTPIWMEFMINQKNRWGEGGLLYKLDETKNVVNPTKSIYDLENGGKNPDNLLMVADLVVTPK